MSQKDDRWERLQKIQVVRKTPMEKKLDNITKVIHDPDQFNVNIASRDRIEELEQRIRALEDRLDERD
jgi:polyhydroxyalkanoate synthesis regulator phasin